MDDAYEYSRCNKYGTTLYSCRCPSYNFRKTCRHVDFLRSKLVGGKNKKCTVVDGMEAVKFVEEYGEQELNRLKLCDVFEKYGRLYRLE